MQIVPTTLHLLIAAGTILLLIAFIGTAGCLNDELTTDTTILPKDPIKGDYAPGEISALSIEAERTASVALDEIAEIPPSERTFENTILRFDTIITDFTDATSPLILMGMVHPNEKVAEEGVACEETGMIFLTETYSRRDLYDIFSSQTPGTDGESRLHAVIIREFTKNGLQLADEQLKNVTGMKAELTALETQYNANLNNDKTVIEYTPDELRGVPQPALAGFTQTTDGTYRVTMKYPDYNAVMTYAENTTSRKRMWTAFNNRQAEENTPLIEEAIVLRQAIAKELGYTTWADYQLEGRMAGDSATVMAFLHSLKRPMQEGTAGEIAGLLPIKQKLDPGASTIEPWDMTYLLEKQKSEAYAFDQEEMKAYFPLDTVLNGMFAICESLYGVTFEEVRDSQTWHPDVRLFRVIDGNDASTIGYLYLDLFPREGKYSHFCSMSIIQGRETVGGYAIPVNAIIGNFNPPGEDIPPLLTMDECSTLFHEMGHAKHSLLTQAPYGILAGYNTEWDFVETPSQAFEEWIVDKEILISISGHHRDPEERISPEDAEKMLGAWEVGKSITYTSLLTKSLEDMYFHTADGPVDTTAIYQDLYEEMYGIPLPDGIHQPASFSHLMGGYDAGYYGYLWSKVYAMNIVDRFIEDGMTNRTTGMAYRTTILEQGNMADGMVLLTNFLGEEPGIEPLYRHLGIEDQYNGEK